MHARRESRIALVRALEGVKGRASKRISAGHARVAEALQGISKEILRKLEHGEANVALVLFGWLCHVTTCVQGLRGLAPSLEHSARSLSAVSLADAPVVTVEADQESPAQPRRLVRGFREAVPPLLLQELRDELSTRSGSGFWGASELCEPKSK
eukprot:COSAG02_NODE_7474_length_2995_cov_7.467541_2_plen_154_part_00